MAQENAVIVGGLPGQVLETSGLIYYNGKLITHNDSGNTAQLFEIDTLTLEVDRIITITNATNVDWEDITQDEKYIYIGDIGNNNGNREDLTIYRISKTDYDTSESILAENINFSYEDQTNFSETQNNDWDAEAIIAFNDQLLLFTKQWQNKGTTAYSIPKTSGTYSAVNLGTYAVDGLITGATFNEFSKVLFMVGYSEQLQPFSVRIENIPEVFAFNGSEQKINFNIGFSQVEGIAYVDENHYFLSSERFINSNPPITLEASLFTFKTEDIIEEEENSEEEEETPEEGNEKQELIVFRNFGSKQLQYELNMDAELFGRAIFDTSGRRISYTHASNIEGNTIDLTTFGTSVYYLTFYLQGRTVSIPFVLD